jgi:hypothetical protein
MAGVSLVVTRRLLMISQLGLLLTATLALGAWNGGDGSSQESDTSKFIGKWTYQAGSAIVLQCPGAPAQTIDLSKVPPADQPGFFTFSAGSGEVLDEVDARGCHYTWDVSGDVATATPGQSCSTFPDGKGGSQLVHLQSGTKITWDGAVMVVGVQFTTATPGCTATVYGTAVKAQ